MDNFRQPVGPLPSSIYWRRRIIVICVLLLVTALVLWVVLPGGGGGGNRGGGEPSESPRASITPGPSRSGPAIDDPPGRDGSNDSAEPGDSPDPTETSTDGSDGSDGGDGSGGDDAGSGSGPGDDPGDDMDERDSGWVPPAGGGAGDGTSTGAGASGSTGSGAGGSTGGGGSTGSGGGGGAGTSGGGATGGGSSTGGSSTGGSSGGSSATGGSSTGGGSSDGGAIRTSCTKSDVTLNLRAEDGTSFTAAERARFLLKVVNESGSACRVEAVPVVTVETAKGGKEVWSSEECPDESAPLRVAVRPGETGTAVFQWGKVRGDGGKTCDAGALDEAPAGEYEIAVEVPGVATVREEFTLKG